MVNIDDPMSMYEFIKPQLLQLANLPPIVSGLLFVMGCLIMVRARSTVGKFISVTFLFMAMSKLYPYISKIFQI